MSERLPASENRRPSLLVLASTYPRWKGDPEPGFVHELSRRLADHFDVTVLCPHARGASAREQLDGVRIVRYRYAPSMLEVLVNDGGIVTNLRRRRWTYLLVPGFVIAQIWSLWRCVRRMRPDVIHAHWLIPQGVAIAMLGAIGARMPPFLVTSHGADLYALGSRVLVAAKRFVARRAAALTVVSVGMLEEMSRLRAGAAEVKVLSMGVDLRDRFRPTQGVVRSTSELLFVGRMVEKKGLRFLIEAMPRIIAERPEVTLTIVGFGPEEACRRAQVESLGIGGRVTFLGPVSQAELPALYSRAAVFVAPFVQARSGDQEGLGLVMIEALGCGCPVIASRLPATAHLIDTIEGLVGVEPANASVLAEQVLQVLNVPPTIDRASIDSFDWSRTAAGYADILLATIKRTPTR